LTVHAPDLRSLRRQSPEARRRQGQADPGNLANCSHV
jgi:hypothetical protein